VPSVSGGAGTSATTSFSGPPSSLHSTARICLPPLPRRQDDGDGDGRQVVSGQLSVISPPR
jgi:hypothetical protein